MTDNEVWASWNRWRISLHEAGHVIAWCALSGRRDTAGVCLDGGGGLAYVGDGAGRVESGAILMAGNLAGELAERYPAPTERPTPVDCTAESDSLGAKLHDDLRQAVPDDEKVAKLCTNEAHMNLAVWTDRFHAMETLAQSILAANEAAIIEVARKLFLRGCVTQRDLEGLELKRGAEMRFLERLGARRAARLSDYEKAVLAVAAGREPVAGTLEDALHVAGKTPEDLLADAERRARRIDLGLQVAAESECVKLMAAAEGELVAFEERRAKAEAGLDAEYAEITGRLRAAREGVEAARAARQELERTATAAAREAAETAAKAVSAAHTRRCELHVELRKAGFSIAEKKRDIAWQKDGDLRAVGDRRNEIRLTEQVKALQAKSERLKSEIEAADAEIVEAEAAWSEAKAGLLKAEN